MVYAILMHLWAIKGVKSGVLMGLMGALSGALGAARADYMAFAKMACWTDFTSYNWGTASFRWVHGAIVGGIGGAVTGAGYGALA